MSNLQSLATRSRGIFLGAAAGDALGWPQEQNSNILGGNRSRHVDPIATYRAWSRYAGGQYHKYVDPVSAGSYSDDTQLILATARAIQSNDWFGALCLRELPLFLLYARGAGGATLRACRTWSQGMEPWRVSTTQKSQKAVDSYFRAGGNGVAMRIAPHVVTHAARSTEELVSRVVQDGIATHGHPRALVGAAAYAVALHALITSDRTLEFGELSALVEADQSWQRFEVLVANLPAGWLDVAADQNRDLFRVWEEVINEMRTLLASIDDAVRAGSLGNDLEALESLGAFDRKVNGAGTITAAASIYLASRNAPRPMSGLLRAAFVKNADTDTLASMTGALLGALHGPEWLANLKEHIQDRGYIEAMADDMTARAFGEERSDPGPVVAVTDRDMRRFKDQLTMGLTGHLVLPDRRPARVVVDGRLETSGNSSAHRWIVEVDRQTMVIDRVARPSEHALPQVPGAEGEPSQMNEADIGSRGQFFGLTLRTKDLQRVENFYASGLGVRVERLGEREVLVDGVIMFVQDPTAIDRGLQPVLLSFDVDDLSAVARRLGLTPSRQEPNLMTHDPAGNRLNIRQANRR